MERKCKAVIEKDNGQIGVCGGEIELYAKIPINRDRFVPVYHCKRCGHVYSTVASK